MKVHCLITLLILLLAKYTSVSAQLSEKQKVVDDINRNIDYAVVKKDVAILRQLYADDFVFTHGTGYVEGKESWIKDVENPAKKFTSREHDSTLVELHQDLAIVTGRLIISRSEKDKVYRYGIRYIRVFALRNKDWQLVSHRTIKEWHYN
jgi:ketosteroid isomerase-like protein